MYFEAIFENDPKSSDEREIIYSRNPRNITAGFMDIVVFELGLGDWTGDGIPASRTVRERAEMECTGDHFGWRMTKNGGSKVGRKQ